MELDSKQLLFIGEETPELAKLRNDLIANKLDVEVYNTLEFEEAHTILMNCSPMVIISTDILMLVKLLVKEKKFVKEKSTKTILFNNKGPLPKNVEAKLNQCGLTDELTEQSPAKTLYYKTTLYLKSLPSQVKDDDLLYVKTLDSAAPKKEISYIKDVETNTEGEVEFSTETGIVEAVVLTEFCNESNSVLAKAEKIIEQIEDEEIEFSELAKFSDFIDGIMGTSGVLGLDGINIFCRLTKSISDHILHYDNEELQQIVVGVLGDAVTFLGSLMEEIRKGDETALKGIGNEGFVDRLKWLSEKFKLTGDNAKSEDAAVVLNQDSIDDLLASLAV